MIDGTRKDDLEQLSAMLQNPYISHKARYEIEETMHKIINQSVPLTSLRQRLVNATRAGDVGAIRKIQAHIHAVRQQETQGQEF